MSVLMKIYFWFLILIYLTGKPDLLITFTRDPIQIEAKCRKALGSFLLKQQVYKSLGDIASAKAFFGNYSKVSDDLEYPFLKIRDITLARKKPNRLLVQSSTSLTPKGSVELKSYQESFEGVITSVQDHYNEKDSKQSIENILVQLSEKDEKYWQ